MVKKYTFLLFSIVAGLMMGLATVFGQKYLPGTWNSLANSGSVWVVPAFYMAALYKEKWKSIVSSILYLLLCVTTYYGYYAIVWKIGFGIRFHQAVWLGCAVVFGFIFGLGGNLSQYGNERVKYIGKTMLSATFLSESLLLLSHFQHYSHMVGVMLMWLIVGIGMYFVNCKRAWKSKQCLLSLFLMTGLGFTGFQLVYYSDILA